MNQVSDLVSRWHIGRIHPTPDLEPDGWTLEKLCDIAKLESGHTPSRNRPDYWDGGIPWLSLHDSKTIEGKVLYDTKMTVSALGLANSSARLLPKGTVALSRTATIGKVAVLGRQMATSQDFACYVCGPRLHNRYLAHLFRGMEAEWDRLMAGSTHNTIYMPTFENMQILVPPMEEQEAIAETLSDADALIEGLERLIAKKRFVKQGAMQDLLTAKRRLPGFSGEWANAKLGSIARIITGPFGTLLKASEYGGRDGVPLISVGEVRDGYFRITPETPQVAAEVLKRLPQYILRRGDIVFGRKGGVDRSAIVSDEAVGWFLGSDGMAVRIQEHFNTDFFGHFLRSQKVREFLLLNALGTTMPSLNQAVLGAVPVQYPDEQEQEAIAGVLTDMDAEIQALEIRLEKAQQVKEGMMQTLLTGRIRLV